MRYTKDGALILINKFKFTKSSLNLLEHPSHTRVYWDDSLPNFGLRIQPTGKITFFAQTRYQRKPAKATVGYYPLMSPEEARREALAHINALRQGRHPSQVPKQSNSTLGDVLTGYIEVLLREGKTDTANVRGTIHKHVRDRHQKLWRTPAVEISNTDCVSIIRCLIEEKKLRTAERLRAYLHAAFERVTKADPNSGSGVPMLDIANPAKMVPVKDANRARTRYLSEAELKSFWILANQMPTPDRDLICLHLLLGGQRQAQEVRCLTSDITAFSLETDSEPLAVLEIRDRKGRSAPSGGRQHLIPLLPQAEQILKNLTPYGPHIFSSDGGVTPIHNDRINRICRRLNAQMQTLGQLEGERFTAGDLRRTVETLLARLGVSIEHRGHLQSHGISGVQARHYDRYDYLLPKYRALEKFQSLLGA
jgi:integrase